MDREVGTWQPPALAEAVHVWAAPADQEGRALREVLARYLEVEPEEVELRAGPHGKPALADPGSALRFNLSHSGELALIAVAHGREVGIDVERVRPRRRLEALAKRALDPAAAATVHAAPPAERLVAFHWAWTRREAIAKCHGTGLGAPLPPAQVAVTQLDFSPGYAAALAIERGELPCLQGKLFLVIGEKLVG